MERLPYIDEHSIVIGASRERVWEALASALRAHLAAPEPLARLLGVTPARFHRERSGTVSENDTMPGFAVAEARAPQHLALRGHHRFSRYELAFEVDPLDEDSCTLRARTSAAFPGLTGRAYRALVIGSGGHRLVVGRLLRNVARRARPA
jgi:hypothetical protein